MKEKRFKKIYSQGAIDGVEIWVDTETGVNDLRVKTFLEEYNLDDETKEMVAHKNAEKLFRI